MLLVLQALLLALLVAVVVMGSELINFCAAIFYSIAMFLLTVPHFTVIQLAATKM